MPVTAQTAPGFLSAPRAVYAPLLTPQKYARESGKTYGHSRLLFSCNSGWIRSHFGCRALFDRRSPLPQAWKRHNYNTRLPYNHRYTIHYVGIGSARLIDQLRGSVLVAGSKIRMLIRACALRGNEERESAGKTRKTRPRRC